MCGREHACSCAFVEHACVKIFNFFKELGKMLWRSHSTATLPLPPFLEPGKSQCYHFQLRLKLASSYTRHSDRA